MEFVLYLLLGGCAGVLAGLFGVGGGMIIVPVLVFSFTLQGFDPLVLTHLAVGSQPRAEPSQKRTFGGYVLQVYFLALYFIDLLP